MKDTWVPAYVGLGSNLQNPVEQVNQAIQELGCLKASYIVTHSRLYRSPPWGLQDQPHYINAVAAFLTRLRPLELLAQLRELEERHGRDRSGPKWGPRTLDLDLLLYGEHQVSLPGLSVPHPRMAERDFVLYPLVEIAPSIQIGKLGCIGDLVGSLGHTELEILGQKNKCKSNRVI